ncbi:hypothetical protein ACLRGI_20260 [Paenarthrobacter nitroguajacolicus]|uniref:hypothetical protein n=1 Tax=Paenarthrobacter nitroguajacolicus TaxID=211146 RepID=UPI003AE99D73
MSVYVVCPMCEQGRVETYRVKATGEVLQLCDECDSTWDVGAELSATEFGFIEDFLKERGLDPLWAELERVEGP